MSYPDPYHPQAQPPGGPYPPGAYPPPSAYGHPPSSGYQPAPYYPGPQQPSYYPGPPAPQQKSDGDSPGWQLAEMLLLFGSTSSLHGLGDTARDRVKVFLLIIGAVIGLIVSVVLAVVLKSHFG